jgi:ATP-dependent Zn protease
MDSAQIKDEMASLVDEIRDVRNALQEKVLGQNNAINVFTKGYFQGRIRALIDKKRKGKPLATFLFAGSPGVGKTLLAETAAETLGIKCEIFDMSQYSFSFSAAELCGGAMGEGKLTRYVDAHPKCFLLFDEIEKAHGDVINLFLQILGSARLIDGCTRKEVSFKDTIIVFTTNAGKQLYDDDDTGDFSGTSRKVILKALENDINPRTYEPFFPPAICSRFASGNVVMFNRMRAHVLHSITKGEFERHAKKLCEASGINIDIDESVYTALLFSEGGNVDARTATGRSEAFFNDELYELMRLVGTNNEGKAINGIEKLKISVDLSKASDEVRALFENKKTPHILLFAEKEKAECVKNKLPQYKISDVSTFDDAMETMKKGGVDFVVIDVKQNSDYSIYESLNIEDVISPARDFLNFIREHRKELPVYLLETDELFLNDEEKISYQRRGVRGFLNLSEDADSFGENVAVIVSNIHRQASMEKLARGNKLMSYETAQTLSEDGKCAEIKLFDFSLKVAIEADDADSFTSAVSKPNASFSDIIGASDAKKELQQYIKYLSSPDTYLGSSAKAPKGVLLYGPPGTGKTMLAKAMACEAGVAFIATEGNAFLKKYVGEGPEKVHEIFKTARKYAPAIIFIDEVDVIARERTGESRGSEDALNALLTEMDGFAVNPSRPVFVLAATNYDVSTGGRRSLDGAFTRRFDRAIYVDLPNKEERIEFLKLLSEKNPALRISEEKMDNIAIRSAGMSLAALSGAVDCALREAIARGMDFVDDALFEESFETFNFGEEKKWSIDTLKQVAVHESGHAFLCYHGGETPSYLTVVARGKHGGYMQHGDNEDKALYTKKELLANIRVALGGRAAELVFFGDEAGLTTGASGDLKSATNTALNLVCNYGMDESIGLASFDYSVDKLPAEVVSAVNKILSQQMKEAIRIVSENRHKIESLVEALLAKDHLMSNEIVEAINKK